MNNNNLPMLYQGKSTAIKEYQKKETGVMEYPFSEEDLTHPGLYRHRMNSATCYSYTKPNTSSKHMQVESNTTTSSDWDLYPGLIRDIVNEGSPEQVEKLQQMQQSH
jgi:hypothetical protein